jgi:hypothetical protein
MRFMVHEYMTLENRANTTFVPNYDMNLPHPSSPTPNVTAPPLERRAPPGCGMEDAERNSKQTIAKKIANKWCQT